MCAAVYFRIKVEGAEQVRTVLLLLLLLRLWLLLLIFVLTS